MTLPVPPQALGAYVTSVRHGDLLFLSGMLPLESGVPAFTGRVGRELSVDQGQQAARLAALLRLAENLDRSKSQIVQDLQLTLGDPIRAVTRAGGDAAVEIWDTNRGADLFEKAFGRAIEIE